MRRRAQTQMIIETNSREDAIYRASHPPTAWTERYSNIRVIHKRGSGHGGYYQVVGDLR
jgi:hypothetical protein